MLIASANPQPKLPLLMRCHNSSLPILLLLLSLTLSRVFGAEAGPATVSAEVLARTACSSCHLFPDPRLLDKPTWTNHIFPKMRLYMGLDKVDVSKGKDSAILQTAGYFPAAPLIPESAWSRITEWIVSKAPAPTNSPSRNELLPVTLTQFKIASPQLRRKPPNTTFVQIDPVRRAVFTSDATEQSLDILSPRGALLASTPVGNIVTSLARTPEGLLLGCIGNFFPSEQPLGQVIRLRETSAGLEREVLFSELPRISHLAAGDFNQDGRSDFALSMFGFLLGRFSWFESTPDGKYTEHILLKKPGAVKSIPHDFDRNGHLDLAVLFGQDTDGLLLFMNDGKGGFAQRDIFRRAPVYGHADFELADFNRDGIMDFLVANGDNGDYESPPKPYHGIRIYLSSGGEWKEAFFFPQHGAFHAVARDFDLDGDLDIASVSFFPDYEQSPRESFVYLENKGGLKFEPSTFAQCVMGRWLTMDSGDLDGDGDDDIVLASLIRMPSAVPDFLQELWEKQSPSLLYLINQKNSPKSGAAPSAALPP